MAKVLDWLTQPQGPHLVDGTSTKDPLTALAILITPEALYDSDSPMVGLGFVYKALYIRAASWSEAYFDLKLASQAEASNRTTGTKIIFVQIQESSQVISLPRVPTLFLDAKTSEDITDSKDPRPPQDFRGFKLHRVIYTGVSPPIGQVALPRLQGETVCHWAPSQTETGVDAQSRGGAPAHGGPLRSQCQPLNDPIFPSCLDTFKTRHEASLATEAATLTRGSSSRGESSPPPQGLPLATWLQPPPTPTLEWWEVDERVAEVMDQVHNLHLETMQEMGFVQEVDQALSKSLMVEFLRLKVITEMT